MPSYMVLVVVVVARESAAGARVKLQVVTCIGTFLVKVGSFSAGAREPLCSSSTATEESVDMKLIRSVTVEH